MANAADVRNPKPVMVTLGDKERRLKFDMNAFIELENRYGTLQEAFASLQKGRIADVRTILWAGLIHEEVVLDELGEPISYNITPYQVGSWVKNPQEMQHFAEALTQALKSDMPEEKNLVKDAKKPKAAPKSQAAVVLTEEEIKAREEELKNA